VAKIFVDEAIIIFARRKLAYFCWRDDDNDENKARDEKYFVQSSKSAKFYHDRSP